MKEKVQKLKESPKEQSLENTELKEIKPEKKRFKLRYLILLLAVVGFMFYSVITIINQNVDAIAEGSGAFYDFTGNERQKTRTGFIQ